jgi:hypothetical protein
MLPSYYSFVLPSITGWVELGFRVCWRVWLWGEGPCPPGLDFSQKPFQFCKLSTLWFCLSLFPFSDELLIKWRIRVNFGFFQISFHAHGACLIISEETFQDSFWHFQDTFGLENSASNFIQLHHLFVAHHFPTVWLPTCWSWPLVPFSLPVLGAFFLWSLAGLQHLEATDGLASHVKKNWQIHLHIILISIA